MTQNCLACHQPMHEGEDYYCCWNYNCVYYGCEVRKDRLKAAPPHPLEKKMEELQHKYDVRQGAWIERANIMDMFSKSLKDTETQLSELKEKVDNHRLWLKKARFNAVMDVFLHKTLSHVYHEFIEIFGEDAK